MRNFLIISILLATISMLYKWRYRILNILLAITVLRRMFVKLSMSLPNVRYKIFEKSSQS